MRPTPILLIAATLALGGCVVAEVPVRSGPPVAYAPPPVAYAPAPVLDPYCRQEAREARAAQEFANRERREARYYGGRRQAYEAARAQQFADRERYEAQRAC